MQKSYFLGLRNILLGLEVTTTGVEEAMTFLGRITGILVSAGVLGLGDDGLVFLADR